jgi:hypothetical protein
LFFKIIKLFFNFRPFDAAVSHVIIAHLTKGNIEMADKIKEYVELLFIYLETPKFSAL